MEDAGAIGDGVADAADAAMLREPALLRSVVNASTPSTEDETFELRPKWPLYIVCPAATLIFWVMYLWGWRWVTRLKLRDKYDSMAPMNQRCWRANCNSFVHTWCVVGTLAGAFASDSDLTGMRTLHQHYSEPGYIALCISLGYFAFAIPWSYNLYFIEKKREVVQLGMVFHHACVMAGCLVYLLGLVCALFGAVAFACMEFTNCFFIPHILAEQMQHEGSLLMTINGALLVLSYVGCRIVICTWVGVLFAIELADFASDSALEWVFVIIAFTIYAAVLLLSWCWLPKVLTELKNGLAELGLWPSCCTCNRLARVAESGQSCCRRKPRYEEAEETGAAPAKKEVLEQKFEYTSKRKSWCHRLFPARTKRRVHVDASA